MKNKSLALRVAGPVMAAVLLFSSCVKSNDQEKPVEPAESNTTPAHNSDPTNTTPPVYNYAALSDSLQAATFNVFISFNKEYFKQNNTGSIEFNNRVNVQMLEVLTDGYQRGHNTDYLPKMKALLLGIKDQNGNKYASAYADDLGYLGNACIRDYVLSQDAEYLTVAKQLYQTIKLFGNTDPIVGLLETSDQPNYKTTAATANACILAARIYNLERNAADLAFAKGLYDWMKATVVLPTGEVMNGINRNNSGVVDNNVYTHNQGLFIGAAVEMYNITKDRTYLQDAITTASNSLTDVRLLASSIWKNEGQGDGGFYKGVLVRYLTLLIEQGDLDVNSRKLYTDFLQKSVRMLYYQGIARPSLMVSPDWSIKPGASTDLTTQVSGIVMMEAAARLQAAGRIE